MTAWDVLSVLGTLVGFVLLLVLAWWASRAIGRAYAGSGAGRTVQLLDRVALGGEKQLLVVKAAGKVLLLGVTAHQITFLQQLDEAELPPPAEAPESAPFLAAFKRALDAKKGRETGDDQHGPAQSE